MGRVEPQRKECQHSQITPRVVAAVFISLLAACFIASCLVTHHSFPRCRRGTKMFKLPQYHRKLTCVWEASGQKGGTWNCCPAGWRAFQSHCYFPFNDNKTWAESERNCSGMGAHLASIASEAEQNFTTKILNKVFSYFIGLKSENMRGQWLWIDETTFNPHKALWHENKLNSIHKEDCAVLVNDRDIWGWNDFPCNLKTSRICKIPSEILM